MNDFQPGDHVFVKRRRNPTFEVVRKVSDTGWEVKTKDGIVRFFWDNEVFAAPEGSRVSAAVDVNKASSDARVARNKVVADKENPQPKTTPRKKAAAE